MKFLHEMLSRKRHDAEVTEIEGPEAMGVEAFQSADPSEVPDPSWDDAPGDGEGADTRAQPAGAAGDGVAPDAEEDAVQDDGGDEADDDYDWDISKLDLGDRPAPSAASEETSETDLDVAWLDRMIAAPDEDRAGEAPRGEAEDAAVAEPVPGFADRMADGGAASAGVVEDDEDDEDDDDDLDRAISDEAPWAAFRAGIAETRDSRPPASGPATVESVAAASGTPAMSQWPPRRPEVRETPRMEAPPLRIPRDLADEISAEDPDADESEPAEPQSLRTPRPVSQPKIWDLNPAPEPAPEPERPALRTAPDPVPAPPPRPAEADAPPEAAASVPRKAGRVKTRLLGFGGGAATVDPIAAARQAPPADTEFPVGWLVVTGGPGRGASFTLHSGASTIGRGEDQAVRLDFGDTTISREIHAVVAYDDEQQRFFVGHGGKANLVRLNDNPVLSTESLSDGDIIRIGETTLRFVALCGPDFSWTGDARPDGRHAAGF